MVPKETKWVVNGSNYGGEVAIARNLYQVDYKLITDEATIKLVTKAYDKKYQGSISN